MLLSVSRASKELGVCKEHTWRQIRAGLWPCYRLGKKATRIDVAEIKNLTRLSALSEKINGKLKKQN